MYKETADKIEGARGALGRLGKLLDLPKLRKDIEVREAESGQPSFWADSVAAKKKSKELNDLKKVLGEYEKAQRALEDLKANLELAAEAQDVSEVKEVQKGLAATESSLAAMDARLKLSGEFDANDAIVSLHAGAGGTEACDWCDMLVRMYTRWAGAMGSNSRHGYSQGRGRHQEHHGLRARAQRLRIFKERDGRPSPRAHLAV